MPEPTPEEVEGPTWPPFTAGALLVLGFNGLTIVLSFGLMYVLLALASSMNGPTGALGTVAALVSVFATSWTLGIAWFQFFYVGPLAAVAYRGGRKPLASGMLTGAAITFLLNGCCYGAVAGFVGFCFVMLAFNM